jgi:uncharacterized protein YkwD/outer membrane protein assembly factor BamE (lipoprotein component of BamABCDE complex)
MRFSQKLISVTLAIFILLMSIPFPAQVQANTLIATKLQDRFIIKDGRTLVPMREIFQMLGATVTWDGQAKNIIATKDNTKIYLQIGNKTASTNGKEYALDVRPMIFEGRTMVPTRFVVESLGSYVTWDGARRIVQVQKDEMILLIKESSTAISQRTDEFQIENIGLGSTKKEVLDIFGNPKRVALGKYGFHWYTFHHKYKNFTLIGINQFDKVVAVYTNDLEWSSKSGLKVGSSKIQASKVLGEPLKNILKTNNTYYPIPNAGKDLDMFLREDVYASVFYDNHNLNKLTAFLWIDKKVEEALHSYHGVPSEALKVGFELQNFDLTNSIRVRMGLHPFVWDEKIRETARKHSLDMMNKNFFDHTNLEGKSPFDRMEDDGIRYQTAGENIAMGYMDSIHAHEAWMNSLGHRVNIIGDFERLGVGVAFSPLGVPYYTQNFYTPR